MLPCRNRFFPAGKHIKYLTRMLLSKRSSFAPAWSSLLSERQKIKIANYTLQNLDNIAKYSWQKITKIAKSTLQNSIKIVKRTGKNNY
jgi:hypothetical protein